jgi:hypothetical protein
MGDQQFDPSEHTVDEVNEHLAKADDAERQRVLDAEKSGKNRSTVAAPAAAERQDAHFTTETGTAAAVGGAKPEWDVTTHGPVPEGREDLYNVTGEDTEVKGAEPR